MDGHGQYSVDGVLESNSAVNEHAKASKRSMHGGIFLKKIQSCCWPLKKIYHQFDTFHDAAPVLVLVLVLVLGVSIIIVRITVAKVFSFLLIILKWRNSAYFRRISCHERARKLLEVMKWLVCYIHYYHIVNIVLPTERVSFIKRHSEWLFWKSSCYCIPVFIIQFQLNLIHFPLWHRFSAKYCNMLFHETKNETKIAKHFLWNNLIYDTRCTSYRRRKIQLKPFSSNACMHPTTRL